MMMERGLSVSPGYSTQIAFTAQDIKELPSPYGDCESSEDYVESKCLVLCNANYVIQQCNSKDVHMPVFSTTCSDGECVVI